MASDALNLPKKEKLVETIKAYEANPEKYMDSKEFSEEGKKLTIETLNGKQIKTGLETISSPQTQEKVNVPLQFLLDYRRATLIHVGKEAIVDH